MLGQVGNEAVIIIQHGSAPVPHPATYPTAMQHDNCWSVVGSALPYKDVVYAHHLHSHIMYDTNKLNQETLEETFLDLWERQA
jgi:hypothetical protein